jgi:hypothetical protein
MHLAATHVEVDVVVRDERAEALGDALQLEGERGGVVGQGYLLGLVGMSAISPDLIFSSCASTLSAYLSPTELVLP